MHLHGGNARVQAIEPLRLLLNEVGSISVPVLAGKFRYFGVGRTGPIGALAGEFRRCHPLQRGVRARLVIALAPDLDFALASSSDKNQCALRHSSRKRPLKDSFFALSGGLPGNELAAIVCLDIA